jgi:hypothetical protein
MSLSHWILRLITWDGLLPAFVWLIPYVVGSVFPNMPGLIEFFAAFLIRLYVGQRFISSNHCGTVMRGLQLGVFFIGILILVGIDSMMILTHTGPRGVRMATQTDLIVGLVAFTIYFVSMAFSLYPGYETSAHGTIENDPWSNFDGHTRHRSEET